MSTNQTLAHQFATEAAKAAVPGMLKAIKRVKLSTNLVLTLGLCATYGHQAHFLTHIRNLEVFGWIVPGIFDLGMLAMLVQAQTPGMRAPARSAAMKVFTGLVAVSIAVNVLASHSWIERGVFAAIVAAVGAIKWAASKIGPDFAAMEVIETSIAPAATGRKLDPVVAAERAAKARITKERNRLAKLTPAQKATLTKAANRRAAEEDIAAEAEALANGYEPPVEAPVSPAVV